MSEWQLKQSAPKDGTEILACDKDGNRFITSWSNDVWEYQGGKGGPAGWFSARYSDRCGDHPILDDFDVWQPLPAPSPPMDARQVGDLMDVEYED